MKIPDTRAALRHYDLARDPEDHQLDPVLPEEPEHIHAVSLETKRRYRSRSVTALDNMKQPIFSTYAFEYLAECQRTVRVVLPMQFNTGDPDACPDCQRWMDLKIADPDEYQRQRRQWLTERDQREQERRDVEDWNRQNNAI